MSHHLGLDDAVKEVARKCLAQGTGSWWSPKAYAYAWQVYKRGIDRGQTMDGPLLFNVSEALIVAEAGLARPLDPVT